jgi:hypothetical protein
VLKTSGQIGVAVYPPSSGIIDLWIPILINELISFDMHHLEIGAGYIFTKESDSSTLASNERVWNGYITGRVGYRYQKPSSRFLFRIAFTPIIEYNNYKEFHPSGGISIGYAF